MTLTEALQNHLRLCDEIYQLALDENRFLKEQRRPPDAALLDRRRALLARLDESLAALRAPAGAAPDPGRSEIIAKARDRILQILHLDRENEQLLLRCSLGGGPKPAVPAAAPSQLQKLYERHG